MDVMDDIEREKIREYREHHIGRLLGQVSQAFRVEGTARLRLKGHEGLSEAHTLLLANLDVEGTRINVVAERLEITKQAAGQLVGDLEQKGYIAREPDPDDKRATRITFTEQGWQFLIDAAEVKREVEAEYTQILGEQGLATLYQLLRELLQHFPLKDDTEAQ